MCAALVGRPDVRTAPQRADRFQRPPGTLGTLPSGVDVRALAAWALPTPVEPRHG